MNAPARALAPVPQRRPAPLRRPAPAQKVTAPRVQAAAAVKPSRPAPVVQRPATPAPSAETFSVEAPELDFDGAIGTEIFDTLARFRALKVDAPQGGALARRSLAEARGYTRADLFALAEIGRHYLFSGGLRIALTLFEGLAAIAPDEPYFALALGLCLDKLDRVEDARAAYQRVVQLDPRDPRAELNLAELDLCCGDKRAAATRLTRAAAKARTSGELELSRKAEALLARLGANR